MNNDFFPSHFLTLICGKPGSGKTTLLKFVLKNSDLLYKKYDYVFLISPSYREYAGLFLPKANLTSQLDFDWISEKILRLHETAEYTNVLFVFDDVVSDLYKHNKSKEIMDFIFNRRHLLKNGMISIIITSQKYKFVPTSIRSNITMLITFKLNKIDWKHIKEEIIFSDTDFGIVLNYVFKECGDCFLAYRVDINQYYKNFDKLNI